MRDSAAFCVVERILQLRPYIKSGMFVIADNSTLEIVLRADHKEPIKQIVTSYHESELQRLEKEFAEL